MRRFSLLLCSVALLVWAPAAQAAPTVVDLRNDAVTTFISSFGAPNTATYGQLVTAPAGAAQITNFGFRVEGIPATALFNGEIYAWGGKKATGPALFESPIQETTGTALQDVVFDSGNTPVVPGTQYVLFMSISKIFEGNTNFASKFRILTKKESEAIYPAGKFVFINNGTDEGKWTTEDWISVAQDLQFTASFISRQPLTVTKSGTGSGTVTSDIGGINCGAICSAAFLEDTVVTLTASASPGSTFRGFSGGGCSASPCQVTINNAQSVGAVFADTKPPQATITKHTKKKIVFKSSEPGSTFKCKLDKGKFKPCKSPFKLKGLKAGRHHFSVVAMDPAGNASKPAKLKFRSE